MYAEKGTHLERIQFLEDEIHHLIDESEQSAAALTADPASQREESSSSPSRSINSRDGKSSSRERRSYIPVRIKPKPKNLSSAQTRFQYALGSKPPEPSGAPPRSSRKPPEPSIPPPPGVIQSVVVKSKLSPPDHEVDVFSDEFSPQKFLQSLRMTHLGGDLDLNTSPSSPSSFSFSAPPEQTPTESMTTSKIKSYLQTKFHATPPLAPTEQNSPSPSYSSDTNSSSHNDEWQYAENQRVESRRRLVSPSSAFLPVPVPSPTEQPSKGIERKQKMPPLQRVHAMVFTGSGGGTSRAAPISEKKTPSSDFSVGSIDLNAALAKANQIINRHNPVLPEGVEEVEVEKVDQSPLETQEAPDPRPESFEPEPQSPTPTSHGGTAEWVMIQDPQSGRYYYYHKLTQECTWDRPIGEEIEHQQATMPEENEEGERDEDDNEEEEEEDGDCAQEGITEEEQEQQHLQENGESEGMTQFDSYDLSQFSYAHHLPSIMEEGEGEGEGEEDSEIEHTTLTEDMGVSLKSSFASAALRHLQRTTITHDSDDQDSSLGTDEQPIDAAAALALADEILLRRKILPVESVSEQSPILSREQSEKRSKVPSSSSSPMSPHSLTGHS
jgi:hypothetical protein